MRAPEDMSLKTSAYEGARSVWRAARNRAMLRVQASRTVRQDDRNYETPLPRGPKNALHSWGPRRPVQHQT